MESFCIVGTRRGPFTLVMRGEGVLATALPGSSKRQCVVAVAREYPEAVLDPTIAPDLQQAIAAYFAGQRVVFRARLILEGLTPFQHAVTCACRRIPYGRTCTYGALACRSGHARSARAVGTVMARNRYPLIVPCHRVVASGGTGGFSAPGGVAQKLALLELERAGSS